MNNTIDFKTAKTIDSMSMMGTVPLAFANPLPSLHPLDLLVGLCCGAGLRLAVYLRGKNAKKYRHGMEYGSARWGTPKDIEPFMAPKFADNIILTKTERLILDDFGMERGTEYGLEQVYSVIDSRYRSGKPLIATTNLTLEELQHPQDTPHARIYDRLTSMCAPVRFTGSNFRKETAQEKLERLKQLMKQRKESL